MKIKNAEREADVESMAAKRKIQDMTERCINFLKEREVRTHHSSPSFLIPFKKGKQFAVRKMRGKLDFDQHLAFSTIFLKR